MDLQVDQEEKGPSVEGGLEDCGDSSAPASPPPQAPQPLYPQLEEAFEVAREETIDSMHSAQENVATAPCAAEESSDGGGEAVGLAAPLPSAPPVDDDDDDVPSATRSPPHYPEMAAVQMQPYTERQILGLYTNEQMEHNAQFVDMFLAEQVGFRRVRVYGCWKRFLNDLCMWLFFRMMWPRVSCTSCS